MPAPAAHAAEAEELLLVDDDVDALVELAELLEESGYRCHVAHDAAAARHFLAAQPGIGIALCDLRMPDIDGLTLIGELQQTYPQRLDYVVITGHGDLDDAIAAMRLGVCDFFRKPFDPARLLEQLAALCARRHNARMSAPVLAPAAGRGEDERPAGSAGGALPELPVPFLPRFLAVLELGSLERLAAALPTRQFMDVLDLAGERLRAVLNDADRLQPLAGGRFLLTTARATPAEIEALYARLVTSLDAPIRADGLELQARLRAGVADCKATAPEAALARAEQALVQARTLAGGTGLVFHTEALGAQALADLEIESELRQARLRDELELWYQPIVELENGRLLGFEALLRWQSPRRGLVAPAGFLPALQRSGLAGQVDAWSLVTAATQLARWQRETGRRDLTMSVNLGCAHLAPGEFDRYCAIARQAVRLPAPGTLRIEITEDGPGPQREPYLDGLRALHLAGLRFYLDDYGTGEAALSRLNGLNFEAIKLDRSFVLAPTPENLAICETVIALGRRLGLAVIAEGIEDAAALERLLGFGCRAGQGYWFSPPVPADLAALMLRSQTLTPRVPKRA
ncbi:MAG: EAL domain-containing protein [Lysobacterales bacterium]|uniref:EAL domain-containing protein n=2 Tax=Plasticicumulans sp. TaxID=2307179 RepID=UPI000FBCB3F2|nr:MAG: EAL domain-containing protein [Xanthomonadales bacterium]HNI21452.1 EAL domain-containing protein [Plasticicumulans sp.]